jgi:hypothetical protein
VTKGREEKYLKDCTIKKERKQRERERGEEKQGKGYHTHLPPFK